MRSADHIRRTFQNVSGAVVASHKGGVQMVVTSRGHAAHSSTRDGINANLAMIPFLGEMKTIYHETESDRRWMDDEFDPPSICLNIGVNDHTTAVNVTAAKSICTLCFRPMPSTNIDELDQEPSRSEAKPGICRMSKI